MLAEDLSRVARGLHPDPESVLGVHPLEGGGFSVRVARRAASQVIIAPSDGQPELEAVLTHADGLYEARFANRPTGYRVRTLRHAGDLDERQDPYAFRSSLGEVDLHLFGEGKHLEIHQRLGAHRVEVMGTSGVRFAVWAPHALWVRLLGDFNDWEGTEYALCKRAGDVWEIFVPELPDGALYKFELGTRSGSVQKSDPFGRAMELRPQTASRVVSQGYVFEDSAWMKARAESLATLGPMSIYEVHLPSWRRKKVATDDPLHEGWLSYRELADELCDYVADLGFTHLELLPIMEHPYDGSWGYQVSGYFAPTSRLGSPDDFRYFVDRCHQRNIGVILDWVPAHFPRDSSALGRFDGTAVFEHWDPRRGEHRQWETFVFDWGRPQVKNFLLASALYWLQEFHLDGLRVDAVASMLYLDYGADHPGEWEPNKFGGRENLEAVAFVRELCDVVHERVPGAIVCAEESTAWPGVTRPTYTGGLGFDLKWNMGWMHDTLQYFAVDPVFRSYHHHLLTFSLMYAFSERYLLPLSHDEVVHLKKSLLAKMPGDSWQARATLRCLYALMWAHPGKKLLFMGGEIGQLTEWNFEGELPWDLLADAGHRGIQSLVRDLNRELRTRPALYEQDDDAAGFAWIDANDAPQSVASFVRFPHSQLEARSTGEHVICVGNFTPVVRDAYRIGVPRRCAYREVLNTDASNYGGSNVGNLGTCQVLDEPSHGYAQSILLQLPPLGVLLLVPEDPGYATAEELAAVQPPVSEEEASGA